MDRILIVGLGLIGGSYAEGLTRAGFEVGAVTRSRSSIDYALQKGIISSGTTGLDPDYLGRWDVVVFSLYPHIFRQWVRENQQWLRSGAILTDVTGVKSRIVPEIQGMLRPDLEFVPAHPMAGREVYGVQNSNADIFKGANFILTPTERNSEQAIGRIEAETAAVREIRSDAEHFADLLERYGDISELTPEKHDEMIGFLSQLTHCIAVTLMDCKESHHMVDYTGDSFRDLTRIARINEDMWTELFLENKAELLEQMDLFAGKFKELRDALEQEDSEKMKQMMRLSTERRSYFDK